MLTCVYGCVARFYLCARIFQISFHVCNISLLLIAIHCAMTAIPMRSAAHRAERAAFLYEGNAPLDDNVEALGAAMADLERWDVPTKHAAGALRDVWHGCEFNAKLQKKSWKAQMHAKKLKFKQAIDLIGQREFNELVKDSAKLAAKDYIWFKKHAIERAAITKFKKSLLFKDELQKAKKEQKSVERVKRTVTKLGSYTKKIRRELKQLPGMLQQQMNHEHGVQVVKSIFDSVSAMSMVISDGMTQIQAIQFEKYGLRTVVDRR